MMEVYYNEFEPYPAQWLRNLIDAGQLPKGEVDETDIRQVRASDTRDTSHFFAGIGGWPYALRLAGWPIDRPVWTGSCPCSPFSVAGKRKGFDDERHLWPVWFKFIKKRLPTTIFGEQVSSPLGRKWLAGVRADLEAIGYTVGDATLPAACVGAPHQRHRIWWVAHTYAECERIQRGTVESSHKKRSRMPKKQLSGFLQSHSWPTLSDSLLWAESHGIPKDVGISKANIAIGNAIVPQVAAEFIKAFMEVNAT